ncbi:SDR family oxidoreductase [Pseudomonas sp. RW1P2]|uniref:SDR family oxidoreductase n=1 Tax=Pseudomonas kurunegalensis TaxID=485880 RepID=A0ACC5UHB5_9PSED|nr:SDR family oxidoreductase [Pseudomonas kurunegalensis]QXI32126.1 SDR family oxidoreductase [Pseudomonas promysalinigenes]
MDMHLSGRVVLVTGGASGIGLACVRAMVDEGAKVLIADRNVVGAKIAGKLSQEGHAVAFFQADITSETDIQNAVVYAESIFGQLDSLIGCAGISGPVGSTSIEITADDWDRVMAINVRGNFLAAKHSLHLLSKSEIGSIVFLASDSALVAVEGMVPYCASKGAVLMLTKALSIDHPTVRINCLCPGVVDTPMSRADLGRPDGFEGTGLPVMQAEQLARHVVFLASPVSAPINGTSVVADFGYLARSALPPLKFV